MSKLRPGMPAVDAVNAPTAFLAILHGCLVADGNNTPAGVAVAVELCQRLALFVPAEVPQHYQRAVTCAARFSDEQQVVSYLAPQLPSSWHETLFVTCVAVAAADGIVGYRVLRLFEHLQQVLALDAMRCATLLDAELAHPTRLVHDGVLPAKG